MSTVESLREKCERLERENRELKAEAADKPDFADPSSVIRWFGERIIHYLKLARREKSLTRLRALTSAVDAWAKASRLAHDSSEIESLKAELAELRSMIEAERTGPRTMEEQILALEE